MAATVIIVSGHGATITTTETTVSGTTMKFKRQDNDTDDLNGPIPKPGAGTVYSWRKSLRIKVTATPDGNISNLRFFGDAGSWGTGVTAYAHSKPIANYDQASSADETALISTDGGSSVVDASTLTSGSPLSLNAAAEILANPATGYGTQDMVEMQVGVASTASRGTKGPRVFTYRFDET